MSLKLEQLAKLWPLKKKKKKKKKKKGYHAKYAELLTYELYM
jgi:hypothetical protein